MGHVVQVGLARFGDPAVCLTIRDVPNDISDGNDRDHHKWEHEQEDFPFYLKILHKIRWPLGMCAREKRTLFPSSEIRTRSFTLQEIYHVGYLLKRKNCTVAPACCQS
jgi:hypothetical protein